MTTSSTSLKKIFVTKLNHFSSCFRPVIFLSTLNLFRYLHESKTRYEMFREELSQQLFQLLVIKRLVAHDHFHINAVMNKALDDLRKSQHSKNVLKGQRFLLLRNYDDLSPEQCNRLNKLFEINKELFMAHSLKEQFRIFWQKKSIGEAEDFLNKWCIDVLISGSNYV